MPFCRIDSAMEFIHCTESVNRVGASILSHPYWGVITKPGYLTIITEGQDKEFIVTYPDRDGRPDITTVAHIISKRLSPYSLGICLVEENTEIVSNLDEFTRLAFTDLLRQSLVKEYSFCDSRVKPAAAIQLSLLEEKILKGVCRGMSTIEVAALCGVSASRIKQRLETLFGLYKIDPVIKHKRIILAAQARLAHHMLEILPQRSAPIGMKNLDRQILGYVVQGLCNRKIAARLNKSEYTIMNRIKRLYRLFDSNEPLGNKRTRLAAEAVGLLLGPPADLLGKRECCHL